MQTIGFIGGGNMAEALIKGIITAKLYKPKSIFVSDVRSARLNYLSKKYGVVTTTQNSKLAQKVSTIVLSIKPQNMTEALKSIKNTVKKNTLVISIAAGKKTTGIAKVLGDRPIVRVMPNTPALIGEGAAAIFANRKAKPMLKKAKAIFSSVGQVVVLNNEGLMDVVTALSGSGPAYYFLLMEEMINAATRLGLPQMTAKKLVLQTAKGSALLAEGANKKGQTVTLLRQKVTSPGGTTEAALKVFESGKFGQLVKKAVKKARDRSRELSN